MSPILARTAERRGEGVFDVESVIAEADRLGRFVDHALERYELAPQRNGARVERVSRPNGYGIAEQEPGRASAWLRSEAATR